MQTDTPPLTGEGTYVRPADQRPFRYTFEVRPWEIRASIFEGALCVFEGMTIQTFEYGGSPTNESRISQARDWVEARIRDGEDFR